MRLARALSSWDAAPAPQRALLAIVVAVVAVALVWLVAANPLRSATDRARSDAAHTRLLLDVARERVAESESLARAATAPRTGNLRTAVEQALAQHDQQAAPLAGRTSEDRFAVVIARGRFDAVVAALDALAQRDGVRLVEGTITALVDPGAIRAELTFGR